MLFPFWFGTFVSVAVGFASLVVPPISCLILSFEWILWSSDSFVSESVVVRVLVIDMLVWLSS